MQSTLLAPDEIINVIKKNMHHIKAFSVENIGLFGSVARGEARDDSDLDVLVVLSCKTLRNYMGLKFYLEELAGRKVDLVMAENIKPALRKAILSEVVMVEE